MVEIEKTSIGVLVPDYYKKYGDYVNGDKMIPLDIDGLLPVHRRVLLSTHTIAKGKYVKTANAMGVVAGQWHAHQLDKGPFAWAVNNDFMDGDGQWGCNVGKSPIGPAAERYTKVKANAEIEEMAFKYVDHTKWIIGELDHKEPRYLPTMLPFCLMSKSELSSIGFGFKTQIPCFARKDLVNRLLFLLGERRSLTISPTMPGCKVLSKKDVLEQLLTTGEAIINVQGEYEVDERNCIVYIKGWNLRTKYEVLEKRINGYKKWNLIENCDIGSNDESTNSTLIRFEVIRTKGKLEIFKKMKEAIVESLKSTVTYRMYVVDVNGAVRIANVDEMLKLTHLNYTKTFKDYLTFSISKIDSEIFELEIIKKIRPYLSNALKLKNKEKIYAQLEKDTSLGADVISKVCSKYRISSLMSVDIDSSKLITEKKELVKQEKNLKQEVIKHYQQIK